MCFYGHAQKFNLPTKGRDGKRAAISFTNAASSSIDRKRLRLSITESACLFLSLSFTTPSKHYIFLWSLRIWFAPSWYSFSNSLRILKLEAETQNVQWQEAILWSEFSTAAGRGAEARGRPLSLPTQVWRACWGVSIISAVVSPLCTCIYGLCRLIIWHIAWDMIGRADHVLNSRTLQLYGKDQGYSNQIPSGNHGILLGCWIGACLNIISLWTWHFRKIDFVHQYLADLLIFVGSKISWKKPRLPHPSQFMGLICKVESMNRKKRGLNEGCIVVLARLVFTLFWDVLAIQNGIS